MKKLILMLLCAFQLSLAVGYAQSVDADTEEEKFNRWSASVYGGYIFGERDRGLQIFASRFNVVSEPTWAVGGDVRYGLNSFWAIEAGYRYSTLEGVGFETTMHTASIKNTFNLNRFYRRSSLSDYLNPYVIAGVEQDFFNAVGPDEEFSRSEASLIGGLGLAFRLSNRIEVYGQHEIKLSSNRLDLTDRGYPYDQIGMASGGIRVHFGKSERKPINLAPPTRQLSEPEFQDFSEKVNRIVVLEQETTDLTARVDSLERRVDQMESDNNERFDELFGLIAALENKVDSLQAICDCIAEERVAQPDPEPERELRRTVAAGHYVQAFASRDYDAAIRIRDRMRSALSDQLSDPEEQVFLIQRRQFYEVLIGTYQQFADARDLLPSAVEQMSDSFIITFPRPVHLQELYEGTVIVHD